ncbi:MAG: hypothetical protein WCR74_19955, partial [Betaproteobacteria bacterium]
MKFLLLDKFSIGAKRCGPAHKITSLNGRRLYSRYTTFFENWRKYFCNSRQGCDRFLAHLNFENQCEFFGLCQSGSRKVSHLPFAFLTIAQPISATRITPAAVA